MSNKRRGTRNEHKTMRYLEAIGYACTRAAASLGLFDVIAIGRNNVKAIQVKTNRFAGTVETEQLAEFQRGHPHVEVEIWRWDDRKREPKVRTV